MKANAKRKLDEAVAARVYDALPLGGFKPGDTIEVDVRFGDEGPDSWTRCEVEVEQKHIDMARKWTESKPEVERG